MSNNTKNKDMKIAVVTYYAVTNIGDRILTDTLCWMLSSHQTQIVDINGRYPYKFTWGGICLK